MDKDKYLNSLKKNDILYMLMDYIYNYQDEEVPEELGAKELWNHIKILVLEDLIQYEIEKS